MKNIINIDITINKLGAFEMGDGEYFNDNTIADINADWFIKTTYKNHIYTTTFIPNPIKVEYHKTQTYDDKDFLKMFENIEVYKTSKSNVLNYLLAQNMKIGAWDVKVNEETKMIEIDNFAWFYLTLCTSGKKTILPLTNKLYTDIKKEQKNYQSKKVKIIKS